MLEDLYEDPLKHPDAMAAEKRLNLLGSGIMHVLEDAGGKLTQQDDSILPTSVVEGRTPVSKVLENLTRMGYVEGPDWRPVEKSPSPEQKYVKGLIEKLCGELGESGVLDHTRYNHAWALDASLAFLEHTTSYVKVDSGDFFRYSRHLVNIGLLKETRMGIVFAPDIEKYKEWAAQQLTRKSDRPVSLIQLLKKESKRLFIPEGSFDFSEIRGYLLREEPYVLGMPLTPVDFKLDDGARKILFEKGSPAKPNDYFSPSEAQKRNIATVLLQYASN